MGKVKKMINVALRRQAAVGLSPHLVVDEKVEADADGPARTERKVVTVVVPRNHVHDPQGGGC